MSVIALAAAGAFFAAQMISGEVSDRQILEWTFLLITGVVVALLVEQMADHLAARFSVERLSEGLSLYGEILESGIESPDLGIQRTEKTLAFLQQAKSSVFVSGIAFSNMLSSEYLGIWTEILERCDVRLLMLDPGWLERDPRMLESIAEHLDRQLSILLEQIRTSIANLCQLYDKLPDHRKRCLQVRLYQGLPSQNFEVTDEHSSSPRMKVEMLPYLCGFRNRPHLIVRPSSSGWYDSLFTRLELRWNRARELGLAKQP